MNLRIGIPEKKAQKFLYVSLQNVEFQRASNYFLTCKFEPVFPTDESLGRTLRTEVQRNTARPRFTTRTFSFKLPHALSPSRSPSEPFDQQEPKTETRVTPLDEHSNPTIVVQAFEVVEHSTSPSAEGSTPTAALGGSASLTATGTFSLGKVLHDLLAGEHAEAVVPLVDPHEETVAQLTMELLISDSVMLRESPVVSPQRSPFHDERFQENETGSGFLQSKLDLAYLQETIQDIFDDDDQSQYVPEKYVFSVQIHCAANLPRVTTELPSPFVTCKTTKDAANKKPAKAATIAVSYTRSAVWHERLLVEIDKEEANEDIGLFLAIIDLNTKKYIGKCIIPVDNIIFGEQYNLGLILNNEGSYLLISLTLENYPFNEVSLFVRTPQLYRLTVLLKGFQSPLPSATVVMAALCLIEDGEAYKRKIAKGDVPSIPFNCIYLEDPDAFLNLSPSLYKMVSPTDPTDLPVWDETFQFNVLKEDLFSEKSALIIEYYRCQFDADELEPKSRHIFFSGYSVIPLHQITKNESGDNIKSFDNVEVNFVPEILETLPGSPPTVAVEVATWSSSEFIKYIMDGENLPNTDQVTEQQLDNTLTLLQEDSKSEPRDNSLSLQQKLKQDEEIIRQEEERLESEQQEYLQFKMQEEQQWKEHQMEQIRQQLEEEQRVKMITRRLYEEGIERAELEQRSQMQEEQRYHHQQAMIKREKDEESQELQAQIERNHELVNKLMKDLERQADITKKMSEDLDQLHQQNGKLQTENKELRNKLKELEQKESHVTHTPVENGELEELKKRVALLSQKLQNKIIKKSELERKYFDLQKSHTEQVRNTRKLADYLLALLLRHLQHENASLRKYKRTVRYQEEVIEKMETLLQDHVAEAQREKQKYQKYIKKLTEELTQLNSQPRGRVPSREEVLRYEKLLMQPEKEYNPVPLLDVDAVKKQPVRHSSGGYRRPSPKLPALDIPQKSPRNEINS